MKVNGLKTEHIEVEINPSDVLMELRAAWIARQRKGDWINLNGFWEEEHYTSHSYTVKGGAATEDELEVWKAFQVVMKVVAELKNTR